MNKTKSNFSMYSIEVYTSLLKFWFNLKDSYSRNNNSKIVESIDRIIQFIINECHELDIIKDVMEDTKYLMMFEDYF